MNVTINFKGNELDVAGCFKKGFAGGDFDSPEPTEFIIESIYLVADKHIVVDVTELLEDNHFDIEQHILNLHYR